MNQNLITRILVAIIAIPAILWISYQGGWWLFGMLLLFTVLACLEFLINENYRPDNILFWITLVAVLFLFANGTSNFLMVHISFTQSKFLASLYIIPLTVIFFLITGMIFSTGSDSPSVLFVKHARLLWGVVYVGLLYPIVFLVGSGLNGYSGGDLLLFLFGLIWVGDTAAMEIGKRLGQHKLAPAVSPNKTVEGFIGGIMGAIIIGMVMHFWKFHSVPLWHLLAVAFGCSVFGQLGDLVESMWKRSLNIKDASSIIPGHGGVLDRFDSLLFAAPFLYIYFRLVL